MRKEPLAAGNVYHIYNRGVDYNDVFFTPQNRLFFLKRLRHYCPPEMGTVIAYCLMPNHYHLLIHVAADDFAHKAMQPLLVSYTKAVNKGQSRVGPLFQGPFHYRRARTDNDVVNLSRYIHLNPVTARFVHRPELWDYSSYPEYAGLREGTLPQPEMVLRHFASPAAYVDFVCGPADPRTGLLSSLLIE